MFRLIGAILIISATAAWGIGGVIKLRARSSSLRAITQSLDIMRSEICDRLTPVPELFELLAKTSEYPANVLYRNLSAGLEKLGEMQLVDIWVKEVNGTRELLLTAQEKLVLSRLGYSIGRYDLQEQKTAIDHVYSSMKQLTEKADAETVRDSKVRAFTGIAAGIFTVIILI